ncbi:MAG: hypothetical protein ACXWDN_19720 [Limisphaerales bacterium]
MARIKSPKLFSLESGVDPKAIEKLRLLDPIMNSDTKLFIDPVLLRSSKNQIIKSKGNRQFTDYFGKIIKLLEHSKTEGDVAWRNSAKLFSLEERPELCLGFGGNTTRGRDLASKTKTGLLKTAKEIVDLGVKDPELFSLVGLLEEGVGPDTIGDMTANAILPALIEITTAAAKSLGLKTKDQWINGALEKLPYNKYSQKPQLLVPLDILRDLPIAADWSDVSAAAAQNQQIRDRVNKLIGNIWKIRGRKQKDQLRAGALKSKEAFKALLDAAYVLTDDSYDYHRDPEGHRIFREALTDIAQKFPLNISKPKSKDHAELRRIVDEIIQHFGHLVESNGINYLLWDNKTPRKEKAAQRLFFAVADVYCKANNVDISPETDSGGGPVDFKFSSGYEGRILVEIKLSTGAVVHGYKTQLGVYDTAAKSYHSIFVVIDVGGMTNKLKTILKAKNDRVARKERAPDIVSIDATLKPSASKRPSKKI